jgi:hypothetical protein
VKLPGGDITLSSGVGFRQEQPTPLIRLTITPNETDVTADMWLTPQEAVHLGQEMMKTAFAAIGDTAIRAIAKARGLDGDSMIGVLRAITERELGDS